MCPGVLRHLQPLCTVCVWSEAATGSEAQAEDVTPQLDPLGCPPTLRNPERGGRTGSSGVTPVMFLLTVTLHPLAPSRHPTPEKPKPSKWRSKSWGGHRDGLIKVQQHLHVNSGNLSSAHVVFNSILWKNPVLTVNTAFSSNAKQNFAGSVD